MTGEALKRKLSPMGMTAAQWAELIGVSEKTIYRLFRAPDVRTETVERLCRAMGRPVTFLYGTDGGGEEGGGDDGGADEGEDAVNAGLIRIKKDEEGSGPPREARHAERTLDLDRKVGELLAAQRRKPGDLARHMGVTCSTVTRMCANNSCSVAALMKMADFFGVPVTYFLPTDPRAMEEAEKDRQILFLKGQIEVYRRTLASLLHGKAAT